MKTRAEMEEIKIVYLHNKRAGGVFMVQTEAQDNRSKVAIIPSEISMIRLFLSIAILRRA